MLRNDQCIGQRQPGIVSYLRIIWSGGPNVNICPPRPMSWPRRNTIGRPQNTRKHTRPNDSHGKPYDTVAVRVLTRVRNHTGVDTESVVLALLINEPPLQRFSVLTHDPDGPLRTNEARIWDEKHYQNKGDQEKLSSIHLNAPGRPRSAIRFSMSFLCSSDTA